MARASLKSYRDKRDFRKTAEPKGTKARRKGNSFVVQKHDATQLHYDFRLELDGVLVSWAVPKGPSLDPADKRLAVRTEDHPLEYGTFEGTIPRKEYGGGTVMLWDRGTWEPLEDPRKGLEEGSLKVRLNGERMVGAWALVRMRAKKGETRENWLLIKEKDEHADARRNLTRDGLKSVKTGRAMAEIAKGAPAKDGGEKQNGKKQSGKTQARKKDSGKKRDGKPPAFVAPQLATLVDDIPAHGDDWIYETKFDGYRCLIAVAGDNAVCYTRSGKDWSDRFSSLIAPARALKVQSALIDGEVTAADKSGKASFGALQNALNTNAPLTYFAFDLLELDGRSLRNEPLKKRKQALEGILSSAPKNGAIRYTEHVEGHGREVYESHCEAGYEGVIAKKADAVYRSARTKTWLKVKCTRRQEFVIGGWTPSDKRAGFASLLLGYYEGDDFVYAGRVGTGFDEALLQELGATLEASERKTSPFTAVPREIERGARWVTPKLVAEVDFTEFTGEGYLRHPAFIGLRGDKAARKVVRETATGTGKKAMSETAEFHGVRVTHPDKVLFDAQKLTKADLIAYYEAVETRMMPHLAGRPISLVRCPEGRGGECFFQRHATKGFPGSIGTVSIEESSGDSADYLVIDAFPGVVAAVQMGTLELHIWGCRKDRLDAPDRLVFDLDPDEALDFSDVKQAATETRERLDALGLASFPMLTGGKGIHVIAPLERRQDWATLKTFASDMASAMALDNPRRYVATASKAKRKGRIFIDYLRNEKAGTAVAPYSTRARKGAPVAAPVSWDELSGIDKAAAFTVETMPQRLKGLKRDPWKGYDAVRQSLTKDMLKRVAG